MNAIEKKLNQEKEVDENKAYKGAFEYSHDNFVFSEEKFTVYKNDQKGFLRFICQSLTRVSNGQILKIDVDYTLGKDFLPIRVEVVRSLGKKKSAEFFLTDIKNKTLSYIFIDKDQKLTEKEISIPSKFHIANPAAATSMLFANIKKKTNSVNNYHTIITSPNIWTFEEEPKAKDIILRTESSSAQDIEVGGKFVSAYKYKLFNQNEKRDEDLSDANPCTILLSRHASIPYRLIAEDGTKIEVKFLTKLKSDLKET